MRLRLDIVAIVALVLLLAWVCSSCNVTKKVDKSKEVEHSVVNTHATETNTTTNTYTGSLVIDGDSAKDEAPLSNFISGDTLKTESGNTTTKTFVDQKTKKVVIKSVTQPTVIPISGTVTSVSEKTVDTNTKTDKKTISKHVDKETEWFPNWIWLMVILVIIGILYWKYWR